MKQETSNEQRLLKLVSENPDLTVIPMVEADVVRDGDGYWMGEFGYSEIEEIFLGKERLHVKGDDDPEDVLCDLPECEYGHLPDGTDIYDLTDEELERLYNQIEWFKAIIVYITT